jgi:NADPH:quinone reductase-like Zn-dependent oxidoreductase
MFRYDIIFDTVGPRYYSFELMAPLLNQGGTFVTIISPIFRNVDKYGVVSGLTRTAYKAVKQTFYGLSNGLNNRWAFYRADGNVLNEIKKLVEQNKLKIKLEPEKFTFEQIPRAISHVENGLAKGKVVIKYT